MNEGFKSRAGRKKGSKNIILLRKAILEYTSPTELKNMIERAKKATRKSETMLRWYLEMCFGKPKVFERDAKTVNNIALFLDKLENGQEIAGQELEALPPLYYQRPEPKQSTVQAEQGPEPL